MALSICLICQNNITQNKAKAHATLKRSITQKGIYSCKKDSIFSSELDDIRSFEYTEVSIATLSLHSRTTLAKAHTVFDFLHLYMVKEINYKKFSRFHFDMTSRASLVLPSMLKTVAAI